MLKFCNFILRFYYYFYVKHSNYFINFTAHGEEICGSFIEILDDNSLIHVFNSLPIGDRTRIERVCKRWQNLAKLSWGTVKEIEMQTKFLRSKFFGTFYPRVNISEDMIQGILIRCGRYLKEIVIKINELDCQLTRVAAYCPNIQTVTCTEASIDGFEKLSENCKSLSVLHIIDCLSSHKFVESLKALLPNNKKFRILNPRSLVETNLMNWTLHEAILTNIQPIHIEVLNTDKTKVKITYNKLTSEIDCKIALSKKLT